MIGADGYMHIIDATNGDKLYEIKAPSELENSADFFSTSNMTVDKEAGLVYVCSWSTAYAYKAIR
jgi:outer membrane protein assembly factor BamB